MLHEINGEGKHLLPGAIDDQVHFREPGLTHKATIYTESRAAVAGGVTSFMEMPNTVPPVFTQELLEEKYAIARQHFIGKLFIFYGYSNDNADEALRTNEEKEMSAASKYSWALQPAGYWLIIISRSIKFFREAKC